MKVFAAALVALAAGFLPSVASQSIVDIAVDDGRFTTLVAAVTEAGLAETLSGDGTFTVFAPTDDAFQNVNVTQLLEPQWRKHLESILLYHVLGSEVFSTDLVLDMTAETLEGSSLTVTSLDPPQVDFAEIIIADIDADNGVVHAIDDVLLPRLMTDSIVDIAVDTPTLSTLVDLVVSAGLAETLAGDGPFTVLAPSDDAFAALDEATLSALAADPQGALANVLLYHVIPGIVLAEDLQDGATPATVEGSTVDVSVGMDSVMFNDATVVLADVLANNGVVHVIDRVLIPPITDVATATPTMQAGNDDAPGTIVDVAVGNDAFETLVAALTAADLVGALQGEGPFTVFAPVDEAFDAVPVEKLLEDQWKAHLQGILLYHVVPGKIMSTDLTDGATATTLEGSDVTVTSLDPVMINDANVVIADVPASNGVIHAIDTVLLPPFATNTIVDTAVAADDFSTLVDLVLEAGLADALSGDGPFTVFAPTNDAFAKLPPATVQALLADPSGALTDILLYHVVSGIVLSSDLTDGASPATLNGATVDVSLDPVMINNANVVAADILASNGVIHAIDTVLLPPTTLPADGYQKIKSDELMRNACMEVKDGLTTNGQRVILGDCTATGGGWRVDEDTDMIHSELDNDFCLQAGYGSHHDMVGRVLRIQHCDETNHLQRWDFKSGHEMSPELDDDLCVVWRGTTANIGSDPMILIDCDHADGRKDWVLE